MGGMRGVRRVPRHHEAGILGTLQDEIKLIALSVRSSDVFTESECPGSCDVLRVFSRRNHGL